MGSRSVMRQIGVVSLLIATGAQMVAFAYPTGSIPIPPKPKPIEVDIQQIGDEFGEIAIPSGSIPIPPKPKVMA